VQKKFAFGFDAVYNPTEDSVILDMVADLGRPIHVVRTHDVYRGSIDINDVPALLEKIYISSSGKGLSVKINCIELFGKDINNGEQRYERFEP
jgi:hypothetical protein